MVAPIYGQYNIYIYGNHQKEVFGPIGKVVEKKKHFIKYKRYFFLVCMIVSRNSVDFPARYSLYRSIYPDLLLEGSVEREMETKTLPSQQ